MNLFFFVVFFFVINVFLFTYPLFKASSLFTSVSLKQNYTQHSFSFRKGGQLPGTVGVSSNPVALAEQAVIFCVCGKIYIR